MTVKGSTALSLPSISNFSRVFIIQPEAVGSSRFLGLVNVEPFTLQYYVSIRSAAYVEVVIWTESAGLWLLHKFGRNRAVLTRS